MQSKEALIKKEKKKLEAIFKDIPDNRKKLVSGLIENAAFMAATLAELQTTINAEGPTFRSTNGNGFDIVQEHPAQKSFVAMVAKYTTIINQLEKMLPADSSTAPGADLMRFLSQEDT